MDNVFINSFQPFEQRIYTLLRLNQEYQEMFGKPLHITEVEPVEPNRHNQFQPTMLDSHISRQEVYSAIRQYSQPNNAHKAIKILDTTYPRHIWQDQFPEHAILQVIVNKCMQYMTLPHNHYNDGEQRW